MAHKLIFGEVKHVTDRAILFAVDENGEEREHWIPKSQVEDGDEVTGAATELYVTTWFAEKMGQ